MEELNEAMVTNTSLCLYGGFRVEAVDERDSVTSSRCKIIFFSFFGDAVSTKVKSNSGMYVGQITSMCQGFHVRMHSDGEKFQQENVIQALLSRQVRTSQQIGNFED